MHPFQPPLRKSANAREPGIYAGELGPRFAVKLQWTGTTHHSCSILKVRYRFASAAETLRTMLNNVNANAGTDTRTTAALPPHGNSTHDAAPNGHHGAAIGAFAG